MNNDDGYPDADGIVASFWHPDGPHSPQPVSVASAALAIDELTRTLARAT